jgi:hypothetical protein
MVFWDLAAGEGAWRRVGARASVSLSDTAGICAAPVWVLLDSAVMAERTPPLSGRVLKIVAFAGEAGCRGGHSTLMVVDELRLPEETTRPMMLIA